MKFGDQFDGKSNQYFETDQERAIREGLRNRHDNAKDALIKTQDALNDAQQSMLDLERTEREPDKPDDVFAGLSTQDREQLCDLARRFDFRNPERDLTRRHVRVMLDFRAKQLEEATGNARLSLQDLTFLERVQRASSRTTLGEHADDSVGPSSTIEADSSVHAVALLRRVAKGTSLENWAADHKIGRSTLYDWIGNGGKPLKGKVSSEKSDEIINAVRAEAKKLGLLNPD